ncbi:MAG: hypothetical protein KDC27_08140 [Acidobacteria bacterium]|nr:hypothetical protein [Acidobacteriota bacterium]
MRRALAALILGLTLIAPASPQGAERALVLFNRINSMLRELEGIMGLRAIQPIQREVLTRDEINKLVTDRIAEETTAEEIRQEELFLRMFGFAGEDFDLAEQVVDVMTEQAAALYDYKTKTLYLSDWADEDMQEFALVHELAHALADQHFDLGKFVDKADSSDEDLARSAVIEGQASWVMTEWLFNQTGRSLVGNRSIAEASAASSRVEAKDYPVYSTSPLYLQRTLLFPYTDGLLFQQSLVDKYGKSAFREMFVRPPNSTRQILDPEAYFRGDKPDKPKLPRLRLKGWSRSSEGDIGELDHQILLEQHLGEKIASKTAPAWRGGRYELWEDADKQHVALRYGSLWAGADDARRFFDSYRKICEKKDPQFQVLAKSRNRILARDSRGGLLILLDGPTVQSLEGLPGDDAALKAVYTDN